MKIAFRAIHYDVESEKIKQTIAERVQKILAYADGNNDGKISLDGKL